MAATTENQDGSGAVLSEEISALNVRIDLLRDDLDRAIRAHDGLVERVQRLQPCPEFPTPELLSSAWAGPAGVAFTIQETPGDLVASVDRMNAKAEAAGSVVESIQFQTNFTNAHAAFITYRLPVPEMEAAP